MTIKQKLNVYPVKDLTYYQCYVWKDKTKYGETVYVGSTVEGLLSMKGKRRHWAELLPSNTGVSSHKINCLQIDALGHLWVGSDEGLNIYDGKNYWFNGNDFYSVPDGSFNDMYFAPDGKKYFATSTGIITLIFDIY